MKKKQYLMPTAIMTCDNCGSNFAGVEIKPGKYYCGFCKEVLLEVTENSITLNGSYICETPPQNLHGTLTLTDGNAQWTSLIKKK